MSAPPELKPQAVWERCFEPHVRVVLTTFLPSGASRGWGGLGSKAAAPANPDIQAMQTRLA